MTAPSDLELVRACARMMGIEVVFYTLMNGGPPIQGFYFKAKNANGETWRTYDPLHDKAQCFELVERFELDIEAPRKINPEVGWEVYEHDVEKTSNDANLLRAIVLCVASMESAKERECGR